MQQRLSDNDVTAFLLASRGLIGVAARSIAEAGDVTIPQWRALVVLRPGALTASQLALRLEVHPSTSTRLCDRLARKGWVRRTVGDRDRRETVVTLTADGRRFVDRVNQKRRRELARILARMEPATVRSAVAALNDFAAAAGETVADADLLGWPSGPKQPVAEPA